MWAQKCKITNNLILLLNLLWSPAALWFGRSGILPICQSVRADMSSLATSVTLGLLYHHSNEVSPTVSPMCVTDSVLNVQRGTTGASGEWSRTGINICKSLKFFS